MTDDRAELARTVPGRPRSTPHPDDDDDDGDGGGDQPALGCPDDATVAALLEEALAADARDQVLAHVDDCAACRATLGHLVATSADAPQVIDRYQLQRPLGEGGMGVVWRAWDPALERAVAIKLLQPELDGAEGRARAVREARALARLQHPNIIAVHDVGDADGKLFIATELVEGEPLDRWQLGRRAPEVLAAYLQAAQGLLAAHQLGLVHRDVKPSNILVGRDGRIRVGDFGLATTQAGVRSVQRRAASARSSLHRPVGPLPALTEVGEVLGTPGYMAPEQEAGAEVDARADQFALCLALAEALCGRRPIAGTSARSLAASAAGVEAPWDLLARGLAVDPAERAPDLGPLIGALERQLAPPRRSQALLGAGIVAATTVALAVVALTRGGERGPAPYVPGPGPARAPRLTAEAQRVLELAEAPGYQDPGAERAGLLRVLGLDRRCEDPELGAGPASPGEPIERSIARATCTMGQPGRCLDGARVVAALLPPPRDAEQLIASTAGLLALSRRFCRPEDGDAIERLRRLDQQISWLGLDEDRAAMLPALLADPSIRDVPAEGRARSGKELLAAMVEGHARSLALLARCDELRALDPYLLEFGQTAPACDPSGGVPLPPGLRPEVRDALVLLLAKRFPDPTAEALRTRAELAHDVLDCLAAGPIGGGGRLVELARARCLLTSRDGCDLGNDAVRQHLLRLAPDDPIDPDGPVVATALRSVRDRLCDPGHGPAVERLARLYERYLRSPRSFLDDEDLAIINGAAADGMLRRTPIDLGSGHRRGDELLQEVLIFAFASTLQYGTCAQITGLAPAARAVGVPVPPCRNGR